MKILSVHFLQKNGNTGKYGKNGATIKTSHYDLFSTNSTKVAYHMYDDFR